MSTWPLILFLGCPPPTYEAPPQDTAPDTQGGVTDTADTADTASASVDAAPTIRLLFPQSSTTEFYCPLFTAVVDIDNYELSEENYGLTPTEGEGHWHLTEGANILGATAAEYLELSEPLEPGNHNLVARLVGNDHQEYLNDGVGVSWLVEITVSDAEDCLGDQGGGSLRLDDTGTTR